MLCRAICFLPCVVACLLAVFDHYHHIIRSTHATSSGTLEIQQLTGRKHSELTLLSAERSSSAGGTLHPQCTAGAVRDRVAALPSSFACHTGQRCLETPPQPRYLCIRLAERYDQGHIALPRRLCYCRTQLEYSSHVMSVCV